MLSGDSFFVLDGHRGKKERWSFGRTIKKKALARLAMDRGAGGYYVNPNLEL